MSPSIFRQASFSLFSSVSICRYLFEVLSTHRNPWPSLSLLVPTRRFSFLQQIAAVLTKHSSQLSRTKKRKEPIISPPFFFIHSFHSSTFFVSLPFISSPAATGHRPTDNDLQEEPQSPITRSSFPPMVATDRTQSAQVKKNSRAEEWLKSAVKDKHVRMIPFSEISKVKYNVAKGGSGTIHLGAWRNMHVAIKEQHNTNDLIKEVSSSHLFFLFIVLPPSSLHCQLCFARTGPMETISGCMPIGSQDNFKDRTGVCNGGALYLARAPDRQAAEKPATPSIYPVVAAIFGVAPNASLFSRDA